MKTNVKKFKLNILGFKELRENAEVYIKRIGKGESFTVMRRSQPIFRIVPIDEDDGPWETVIDFTKINPSGVLAEDVIKSIERIHG